MLNREELSPYTVVCFAMLTFKTLIHVASIFRSTFITFWIFRNYWKKENEKILTKLKIINILKKNWKTLKKLKKKIEKYWKIPSKFSFWNLNVSHLRNSLLVYDQKIFLKIHLNTEILLKNPFVVLKVPKALCRAKSPSQNYFKKSTLVRLKVL